MISCCAASQLFTGQLRTEARNRNRYILPLPQVSFALGKAALDGAGKRGQKRKAGEEGPAGPAAEPVTCAVFMFLTCPVFGRLLLRRCTWFQPSALLELGLFCSGPGSRWLLVGGELYPSPTAFHRQEP